MREITVEELARDRSAWTVLDVREPEEVACATIGEVVEVPLGDLAGRLAELPADRPLAVLCQHGIRSARATDYLCSHGYDAANIEGGIEAWSLRVDPAVPRY